MILMGTCSRLDKGFRVIQKQPLEVFYKKGVLENFAILTGKHLQWSFFLIFFFLKIYLDLMKKI